MRILIANLKLLHQRLVVWFVLPQLLITGWLSWFVVSGSLSLKVRAENIWPIGALIIAFAAGLTLGAVQLRIALRPLSFCLPGHLVASRRLLFLVGVFVSYVASVIFVKFVDQDGLSCGQLILALCAAFSASLTLYFIGAMLALGRMGLWMGYLSVMVCWTGLGVLGLVFSPFLGAIGRIIIGFPVPVIVLGTIVATKTWLWMGRLSRFQALCAKFHRRPVRVLPGGTWYSVDIRFFPATLNRALQELFEDVFLRIMRRCEGSRHWQYSLGAIYTTLLFGLTHRWILVALALLFSVGLITSMYFPSLAPLWIVTMSVFLANAIRHAPPCSHARSVIGAGRRERMGATLVSASVLCFLCLLFVSLMVIISRFIVGFLPDIGSASPAQLNPRFILFAAALFPVGGLSVLVSFRGSPLAGLPSALVCVFVLLDTYAPYWYVTIPTGYILASAALAWLLFGLAVRRVALRTDLWSPWYPR